MIGSCAITRDTFKWPGRAARAPARSRVVAHDASDGAIELRYRGRLLPWTEIAAPVKLTPPAVRTPLSTAPHRPARPSADHPWRRDTRAIDRERALSRAASREAPVEAAAAVDAQNAPTAAWKSQNGFHKLPQAASVVRKGTFLFR